MKRKLISTLRKWLAVLFSLATVAASGWVGDGLKGDCLFLPWLGSCQDNLTAILSRVIIAAGLFGLFFCVLYFIAKELLPIRHLAQTRGVTPHRVLISAISSFKPLPTIEDGAILVKDESNNKRVDLTGNLEQDINAFTAQGWRWNGQQLLRALQPHLRTGALEYLVLIGSSGDHGSFGSFDAVKTMVKHYAPNVTVHYAEKPVDFEDIEALQTTFDHWIKVFVAKGIAEKAIIIDATGGMKTTSIAAALTTLRWRYVEFQYVQTNDQPQAISFNVVVETTEKGMAS